MYNLRIVPEDITGREPCADCEQKDSYCERHPCHYVDGAESQLDCAIPCPSEWTAEEAVELLKWSSNDWIMIFWTYEQERRQWCWDHSVYPYPEFMTFPEYFSALISLAPLKGLSKEEIKSLSEARK